MELFRARGRGRLYSPLRWGWESAMRLAYAGGWPGALWGALPGRREVSVLRERLAIPGLRGPLRVGFASDLHIGPTTPPALLEAAFAALAEARPDLLLLGGDYVFLDATPRAADTLARLVAGVPARAKLAVLGNHDLWAEHPRLERALAAAGARVLINEGARLQAPHAEVAVVGLDDPWVGEPDAARAFAGVEEAPVKIALVHAPEGLPHVAGRGVALMLCGHTHGGQVALPGPRPVIVPGPLSRRYPHGRHEVEGLTLLVSRGLGGVEVPFRSYARPDVMVLELGPG